MMNLPFPHANLVAGILVLIVGFVFHWLGQLISLCHWDLAVRLGLAEKDILPEYKDYELGMAAADVAMGWLYGLAGIRLLWGAPWGFRLAWFPGVVCTYHGLCFWFWTRNQIRAGHRLHSKPLRLGWCLANLVTGLLAVLVAWRA
jgi:hypothetical protein